MSTPRRSTEESTGTTLVPVGIPLGTVGLDLRVNPRDRSRNGLSVLLNASFRDERVLGRRPGHRRSPVVDGDIYAL